MKLPNKVHVGGGIIRVRLVDQPIAADGTLCDAIYVVEDSEIQIKRSLHWERRWRMLMHEIGHVSTDEADLELKIKPLLVKKADYEELDEEIVRAISGQFVGALRTAGWLKFPWEK
jgi:uncharacterized HAD superfamily protein